MNKESSKKFPEEIGQLFSFSWDMFAKNFGLVAYMALLASIGTLIGSAIVYQANPDITLGTANLGDLDAETRSALLTSSFIEAGFQGMLYVGTLVAFMHIAKTGQSLTLREVFSKTVPHLYKLFMVSLVAGVIILLGLMLLLIPGIIFALWFSYGSFIVVDEKLGIKATLKRSKQLYKAKRGLLIYWILITLGLSIALTIALLPTAYLLKQIAIMGPVIQAILNNLLYVFSVAGLVNVYYAAKQIQARRHSS